jgi:16S rRNA (guanine966-N2)-methyltransferase
MPSRGRRPPKSPDAQVDVELQIIGGRHRGRKLRYHGDPVTRPMKHRVREAIFNLIGTEVEGKHAIDVFAGTGALGLEALSRGAVSATFIERHIPTAKVVDDNRRTLDFVEQSQLLVTSAFLWSARNLVASESTPEFPTPRRDVPWLVFVSPPYAFFVERAAEMLQLTATLQQQAPPGSLLVVEADQRFDWSQLDNPIKQHRRDQGWDIRSYPPAVVGVWRVDT